MADTNQDDKGRDNGEIKAVLYGEPGKGTVSGELKSSDDAQSAPVAGFDVDAGKRLGDTPADIANQVDSEADMMRIRAATSLLNTFNYAIQVQAGRTLWLPSDYHRFIRALICIDAIGRDAVEANAAGNVPKVSREKSDRQALVEAANNALALQEPVAVDLDEVAQSHGTPMPRVNFVNMDEMQAELDRHTPTLEGARPSSNSPLSSLPKRRGMR